MDLAAYLARIAYDGPLDVTPATLAGLHLAHLYTVPFENLDIHNLRPINLDAAALFDKVVVRRRGGFCYELNGLFGRLLGELGFRVTLLSAEVARLAGGYSPPYDHLALRVDLEEPWLVDVGFGEGFRLPVRLHDDSPQEQGSSAYRVDTDGEYRVLQRRNDGADWVRQYRFTLEPHSLDEFAKRCTYHQTSPDSSFTRERLCTLATPGGRVTLSGMRLIVTGPSARTETLLENPGAYTAALRDRFRVVE